MLTRKKYMELEQMYDGLDKLLEAQILSYDDPVKIFLEISLNQIDFFKKLPKAAKNEWIHNMVPRSLERGSYLYNIGEYSTKMYVIQSGMVEITHKLDKGEEFVIERLYRSSVVNHNSFLMNDGIDSDAKCKT